MINDNHPEPDSTEMIAEIEEWLAQGGDPAPPTLAEAMQQIADSFQAAFAALAEAIGPVVDAFVELGRQIVEGFAHGLVIVRVKRLYRQLRAWYIPRAIAWLVAYLWIARRWPPEMVIPPPCGDVV